MKEETFKAQEALAGLFHPGLKTFYSNGDFSSGEGQPVFGKGRDAYIYCMLGKKQKTANT